MLLRFQYNDQVRRLRCQRLNHIIKGGDDAMKRAVEWNLLAKFICNAVCIR
jgi:hypothetical protein